jgi:Trk K+ transport system NAD-binding subunit
VTRPPAPDEQDAAGVLPAPVLLAGDDGVPLRVREELSGAGVRTVSLCSAEDVVAARGAEALVVGDVLDAAAWDAAGLAGAQAVGLLGPDDLANLNAALLVAERHPSCRIVVRLFAADLAGGVARMLGGRGVVLSDTEVAAPAFLRAALSGNTGQRVTVAGRVLEVAEVDRDDPRLVVALANADTPTDVLPARAALAGQVLGLIDPEGVVAGARGALPSAVAAHHRATRRGAGGGGTTARHSLGARARALAGAVPRRAEWLALAILVVFSVSTAVFALSKHLDVIDSMYFTATTMATVGYGDVNLADAADWLKVYDIGLMAVSAVLLASVLAFVTDLLVRSRIDRALGRFPRPARDHVIVCGLGKAGAAILTGLCELDVPCVGVEQHPDAVGIAVARALEVPVVFADARTPGVLTDLRVDRARAVMAITNDDLANLQCGLTAREHNPELRVVLRIFDPHLAERLDRSVELDLTRSVSGLAAPAFTAALLGREHAVAEPLPLSSVPLRVLEAAVPPGAAFAGQTVGALHRGSELRVLALDGRWRPREDLVLAPGARVAVVGTREACDQLVERYANLPA